MCEVSSRWGRFLIKTTTEHFHIWFPAAPVARNHMQLYKWREVFSPRALRVYVDLMCDGARQRRGRPLLLITDMSCLNVMLGHRCSIQG